MIFSTLEHILNHISFSIVSIVISIWLINLLVTELIKPYELSEKGMIPTFLCLTGLLVTRWIYSGHFPLSDLYESLIFLSWSFSLIHIVAYFKKNKNLSAITASSTIFTQGFATSSLLSEIQKPAILVPALQSEWLIMHVSMMILSYAALLCGSLLSAALLVFTFRKKSNRFLKSFSFDKVQYNYDRSTILRNTSFFSGKNYYKSQLIQLLYFWSYRVISLGFLFLTTGIISGAVWANEAWGSYWSWDPKEIWAFITWMIFAIYLHIRTNKNFPSEISALVAALGFLIIWICYFGVNLLGIGLHSYGSFTLPSS
uniref:Cytochrome c biogenesis protein CcsA n=1 Tax=Lobelia montana TaxID=2010894 RepID=A0A1Z2R0F4_9ASTR|nr:cytochrome c biogenesis protein [Lobelia montana]ASA37178.1 cytochrome c biogenesis protein [Lobelia montana]WGH11183.1 cytochrome c biogenesis protein [Lobelia montana]